MEYDLIVYGGGTSGLAAAYIAGKYNINTLLVEQSDTLGGAITQGLVIPCMKVNSLNINTEFVSDLKLFADKYNARLSYINGNDFWFNPELLKIVFDDMLSSVNCSVLFSSSPVNIIYNNNIASFENVINHKLLSLYIKSKYVIDATSTGKIFKLLNCDFQKNSNKTQAPTLRFIVSGIDINTFAAWIEKFDPDRNVTSIDRTKNQIHMSTAYTWDSSKKWALAPIFNRAVNDGILQYEDTAYFQVFTIPDMPNSLNFNAPRIILADNENLSDPFIYSKALKQARQRIYRLFDFCKKYLPGFNNAFISHISDTLGIRTSNMVKCRYTVTSDDILNPKKIDNPALACDYPIDIHSNKVKNDKFNYVNNTYYVPVDALISEKYRNLYAVGKIISAEFEAQASLRTQLSCFSMGEAAAKDIIKHM